MLHLTQIRPLYMLRTGHQSARASTLVQSVILEFTFQRRDSHVEENSVEYWHRDQSKHASQENRDADECKDENTGQTVFTNAQKTRLLPWNENKNQVVQ